MTIQVSPARRAMLDALNISARQQSEAGLTLDQARLEAQKIADRDRVDMVVGWQINDEDGGREAGYMPAAAIETLVLEPVEVLHPYTGGRADYAERVEGRRERLESAAVKAQAESNSRYKAARAAVENIPMGQPILVGHHSERGHRAALRRSERHMGASVAAQARAAQLARKAEGVGDGGISSDDPAALVKLRAELVAAENSQATMKAANAIIRKLAATDPEECVAKLLADCEIPEDRARELLSPRFGRGQGFPSYSLTNNNANIRRMKARIAELQRNAATPEGDVMTSKSGVIYRIAFNRVQLVFDGKPADVIRERLKSYGFRWAPSTGAWQRHLNQAGKNTAQAVIEWLDAEGL